MKYLLPTFIVLPVLEMYLLIEIGSFIGALNTIGLVLLTALIGLALIKRQGFNTLISARNKLLKAEIPAEELITGFFIAIGGALLLTPGFITDFFGFFCLIPFLRKYLLNFLNLTFLKFSDFSQNKRQIEESIEDKYKRNK